MFVKFFHELKDAKIPVTLKEYLLMMEALEADLADKRVEEFYYLSRTCLIKDERHLDKFDQVFGHVFKGLELMQDNVEASIPEEWLRAVSQLHLSEEDKKKIELMLIERGVSPDKIKNKDIPQINNLLVALLKVRQGQQIAPTYGGY